VFAGMGPKPCPTALFGVGSGLTGRFIRGMLPNGRARVNPEAYRV
jgi:hypothetical protein